LSTQAANRPLNHPHPLTHTHTHWHTRKHILGKAQIVPGVFGVPWLLFSLFVFISFVFFGWQVVLVAVVLVMLPALPFREAAKKHLYKISHENTHSLSHAKHICIYTYIHTYGAHKSFSTAAKMPKSFAQPKTKTKRKNVKRSKNPATRKIYENEN